jgi:uncharacterized membrane protein YoaK (UPF0700 family)
LSEVAWTTVRAEGAESTALTFCTGNAVRATRPAPRGRQPDEFAASAAATRLARGSAFSSHTKITAFATYSTVATVGQQL